MSDSCFYTHSNVIIQNSATKRYKYKIEPELLEQIKLEKERTGISASRLLRSHYHLCPPELSADMIGNWLSGRTTKAYWEHVNWVLERYTAIPSIQLEEV
ncbi:MAG: hypothetical protein ABJN65_18030 [Parasphingorhabdus sp.]